MILYGAVEEGLKWVVFQPKSEKEPALWKASGEDSEVREQKIKNKFEKSARAESIGLFGKHKKGQSSRNVGSNR